MIPHLSDLTTSFFGHSIKRTSCFRVRLEVFEKRLVDISDKGEGSGTDERKLVYLEIPVHDLGFCSTVLESDLRSEYVA